MAASGNKNPSVTRGAANRTPELDQQVEQNYRENITAIKELLLANDIKGIFCTVPTALDTWVPTSESPQFTSSSDHEKWQQLKNVLNSLMNIIYPVLPYSQVHSDQCMKWN